MKPRKRIQDLRALLDEWVHVLGDLLETDRDQKLSEQLLPRVRQIQYPETAEASLISAFVKELHRLGERIQNWVEYSPNFSQTKDLVERTEKQILYGLSLLFQEKTGDIETTAESLRSSQTNLSKLLSEIKEGKLDINSRELEEAFQKLAQKLEELQNKIRNLPQGPEDELINREALQAQAEESEDLAARIEAIKKQMANGDQKGALKELESLLNQLSILSKEMERALDQWQTNLDQGAIQSSERYVKKLEELKKREEELAQKTESLKNKWEQWQKENDSLMPMSSSQQQKGKELQKEFENSKNSQQKIQKDFKSAIDEFEKSLEGTEWKQALRGEETKLLEGEIDNRMQGAAQSLSEQQPYDALTSEKEAIDLLNKAKESQKKIQKSLQQASQAAAGHEQRGNEKIEIMSSEGKGEKERRRKIMESLKQKVDEKYQKSHEQYFEDLLQR